MANAKKVKAQPKKAAKRGRPKNPSTIAEMVAQSLKTKDEYLVEDLVERIRDRHYATLDKILHSEVRKQLKSAGLAV